MTVISIIEFYPIVGLFYPIEGLNALYIMESANHHITKALDHKQAQSVADRLYNSGLHAYGGTYVKSEMIIREWRM